eukprot:TRINITY_DN5895_c0_g1_i1.p1 TRINITY_DN5895_c0_g1~~TRINITY_DN5895_c0_g1_i1.p1  ORF type:complete len:507 (+),score=153.85 TRINITY_DN5895_c0_g1_i1:64-1584(+)
MKWVSRTVASFLPLSAAVSSSAALFLQEATAAFSIPKVPKVENSDADGFPILPTVGTLLTDVSQSMKGLNLKTRELQDELQKLDQTSEAKLSKQKAAYDQLLRKQEGANQKIQASNNERAKAMMGLHNKAIKTQVEIEKEQERNDNQRAKLRSLQDQLKQVQQATADALSATDDAKPLSNAGMDASAAEEDVPAPQRGLSFLQVKPKTVMASVDEDDDYGSSQDEASVKKTDAKADAAAPNPALRSQARDSASKPKAFEAVDAKVHAKATTHAKAAMSATTAKVAAPAKAATSASAAKVATHAKAATSASAAKVATPANAATAKAVTAAKAVTKSAQSAETTLPAAHPHPIEVSADSAAPAIAAEDEPSEESAPAEQPQESMAMASDSTQVLREGVVVDGQMAAGTVASLSSGLKMVQEQVHQSEANLKLHFQKAYRAGKKRHDALIKQSDALKVSMRKMQAQDQKLEATLAKLRATDNTLKQKINSIAGFLGKALAPIGNAQHTA